MLKAFYRKAVYFQRIISFKMDSTKDVGTSSIQNSSFEGEKLIYAAASRNKDPILAVLKNIVRNTKKKVDDESPLFLEIASGSGQHAAHFAPYFPGIKFQPSDLDANLIGSMTYYANACQTKNILPPIQLDICEDLSKYGFEENSIDYIYSSNLLHICPFACTMGLFRNAGAYLKPNALLITYGPYCINGIISPLSNVNFDASLRSRDSSWGLRDIKDLVKLGKANDLSLIETINMPSNNKTLVWKKNAEEESD